MRITALRFIVKLEGSQRAKQVGMRLKPYQIENWLKDWNMWGNSETWSLFSVVCRLFGAEGADVF